MENLPLELMLILGVLSSVIVWLLKKAFVDQDKEVPVWVYNIVLGFVALLLAIPFSSVVLPPVPSHDGGVISILEAVLGFSSALIPVLVAVVGTARIIYEVILQKVLDGLGRRIKKAIGSDIG
jgi:hypothetical protein